MKTLLIILAGLVVGGILGAFIGYQMGELAVYLFDISCFEGGCGYAVVLFALLGILMGAGSGAALFYKKIGPNAKLSIWFSTLLGALLGGLAAQLLLAVLVNGVVWFLNSGLLGESATEVVATVYNIFTYIVLGAGILGGGRLCYKFAASHWQQAVP